MEGEGGETKDYMAATYLDVGEFGTDCVAAVNVAKQLLQLVNVLGQRGWSTQEASGAHRLLCLQSIKCGI